MILCSFRNHYLFMHDVICPSSCIQLFCWSWSSTAIVIYLGKSCLPAQLYLMSCTKAAILNDIRQNQQRPDLIYAQIWVLITNNEVWAVGIGRQSFRAKTLLSASSLLC